MARILIGNIKGPKGDTGIQGPQGPEGPQGPQGPLPPLANNGLTTEPGFALDARYGRTLKNELDQTNSDLTALGNSKADKTNTPTILSSMPGDVSSAYNFVYKHQNTIAPYNGLNWSDMPEVQKGYYGRIETRGYFDATHGGTIYFYSNSGALIASRGFNSSGWRTDWLMA